MERSLLKEVSKKSMAARLNSRKVKPLFFPNFFGIKQVTKLTWETLTGEKGAPVMADVISYDASAPIKTRSVVGKMSGDIPKIAIKRGMKESDYNEYIRLQNDTRGQADLTSLLDMVFGDLDFVYNGSRARMEYLCMQAMSTGQISLSTSNNAGVVTEEAVSFGIPKDNKKVATTDWDTTATADGIQDIEDAVAAASAQGVAIKYAIMRQDDFVKLKKQKATSDRIKSWGNQSQKLSINLNTLNEYMIDNQLPKIVVINPTVKFEDAKHAQTTLNPWEAKRVCLVEDLVIGDVQHGPIAVESSAEAKKVSTMVKKDFVLTTKWSELEPFQEWTKAEANAFPVLNDPEAIYLLKTDGTAWS